MLYVCEYNFFLNSESVRGFRWEGERGGEIGLFFLWGGGLLQREREGGAREVRVWRRPGEGGGGKVVSKKKILKTRLIFCSPKIHLSFCFQRIFSAPSIPLPTTH